MPARLLAPLLLLATLATACAPNEEAQPPAAPTTSVADTTTSTTQDVPAYLRPDLPTETRVDDLLSRMTLAEKIGQMTLVEKNSVAPSDLAGIGIGALLSGGGGGPHDDTPEPRQMSKAQVHLVWVES